MVSSKDTSRQPLPAGVSEMMGALETAYRSSGTMRVTPKTALKSGSSKHGKARRASVLSNCVVAMTCSLPSSS